MPEGLHCVQRDPAIGAVHGELLPVVGTHVGEAHGELSLMGGTPKWSRATTPLPEQKEKQVMNNSLFPCTTEGGGRAGAEGEVGGTFF